MFFQTAKAIVTSLCSRHIVRKKISLNGAIGRPNQIPTLVKDNARTDVFGLQNETTVNKFSPSTVINNAKKTTKNTIPTKTPAYEDDVTADNVCCRIRPHARIPSEISRGNTNIWQNNYVTTAIRNWISNKAVTFNRRNIKTTSDIFEKNWIQQRFFKIIDLRVRTRSYSATDSNCEENNIFTVNEVIPIPDAIRQNDSPINFFALSDSRFGIRKKIEEFCARRKKKSKKADTDICEKRDAQRQCRKKTIAPSGVDCSKRKKMTCKEREERVKNGVDCSKRKKMTCKEQKARGVKNGVDCSERKKMTCKEQKKKISHQKIGPSDQIDDCHKSKKVKSDCTTTKDLHKKPVEDRPRIKHEKKCTKNEYTLSKQKESRSECKKEEQLKKEKITAEKPDCSKPKKEEIKKFECSETEKIQKKECSPVKKAPACSEDEKKVTAKSACIETKKREECSPAKKASSCSENNKKTSEKKKD
ncbi:uncharacterized protein LOC109861963 isoform X1 [Pseudomyrmex gracilis]|uniref:uncharacterized protein LOC109861963 isoform X1 n=1 Tax=Pseudomyrmex gracilis TaxID=219809 RepID=UPI000994B0B2|nr:uncharacterized protein LOC109861963 isoform X1 [Pseudomyrmex gracilis]